MGRRRQNSPLEEMMGTLFLLFGQLPVWSGPAVAATFFAVLRWLLPEMLAPADPEQPLQKTLSQALQGFSFQMAPVVAGGVLFIWGAALVRKRGDRIRVDQQTGLDSIRQVSWQEFESLLSEVFRRQGYTVEQLGGDGPDGGVDQRLFKGGQVTLVQCKHWKTVRVGVRTVRELLGVMSSESARNGIVVTSGSFTADARKFARQNDIQLIDGSELMPLIQSVQRQAVSSDIMPAPTAVISQEANAPAEPDCPRCGSSMRRRTARRGADAGSQFWGCSRYPRCKGTRDV